MKPIALLGDTISCPSCGPPHEPIGNIPAVRTVNVLVAGRPPALQGDAGLCGAPVVLSPTTVRTLVAGAPVLRVGDPTSCGGVIIGPGDPRTIIG